MVEAHATTNSALHAIPDRSYTRHGVRSTGDLVNAVRTRDWWFPLLRSATAENVSLGRIAFSCRHRVRYRWSLATWAGALACPSLFPRNFVLVRISNVSNGGVKMRL